jgi:hypothetical protein
VTAPGIGVVGAEAIASRLAPTRIAITLWEIGGIVTAPGIGVVGAEAIASRLAPTRIAITLWEIGGIVTAPGIGVVGAEAIASRLAPTRIAITLWERACSRMQSHRHYMAVRTISSPRPQSAWRNAR